MKSADNAYHHARAQHLLASIIPYTTQPLVINIPPSVPIPHRNNLYLVPLPPHGHELSQRGDLFNLPPSLT